MEAVHVEVEEIGLGLQLDVLDARGVDRGFFKTLGIQAARGRVFLEEDFKPGRESVALLSWAAWELRFGRDPNIVGRKVRANGQVRTIVGVLPQWYRHPAPAEGDKPPEFWVPMDFSGIKARQAGVLTVIARLKPEVSVTEARSEMAGIGRRLAEQYAVNKGSEIDITPLADVLVSKVRRPLWLLLGAVLVLLLCACVNMANLLLARSVQRQREFAIRAVLGGRRGLLFGQVITEGLVLSAAGALLGIVLAQLGVRWLVLTAGALIPRSEQVQVDGAVLLFTLAVACLTGLLFACVPAFVCSRTDLNEVLKGGGRASAGAAQGRMRSALAAAEVALCVGVFVLVGVCVKVAVHAHVAVRDAVGLALLVKSWPVLGYRPLAQLLFSSVWKPSQGVFGFYPFISGTLWVTVLAMAMRGFSRSRSV